MRTNKSKRTSLHILIQLLLLCKLTDGQEVHRHAATAPRSDTFLTMMNSMMGRIDKNRQFASVEQAFIRQMIPHHEGAIVMANYEVQFGRNFEMVQLAKSILAEQSVEVHQLQLQLQYNNATSVNDTADFRRLIDEALKGMMRNKQINLSSTNTDLGFAAVMVPHHQAGIDMAKALLKHSKNQQLLSLAKGMILDQHA